MTKRGPGPLIMVLGRPPDVFALAVALAAFAALFFAKVDAVRVVVAGSAVGLARALLR